MDQGLVEDYRRKGFLSLKGFFSAQTQAQLRAHGQWVLQALADGTISRSAQLTGGYDEARLDFLKTDADVLRLATALLGPNVRFFQARTLLKDNTFGGMVPAHQDWPFFAGDPNKLNLFIPLTRCGLDQGPLIFYEGSHLFGPLDQGDIDVARYPELTPHTVEADVGDVFAAHFLSWHSSVPATSPEPRLYIQLILSDGGDPAASQVLAGVSTNPHYCANFHAPMARPQPSIHTQLARIWLNAGDVDGAARLAEGMLAVEPRNLDAAILLADVDKARGGSGEAQLNWAMERLESIKADILARLPAVAEPAAPEGPAPRKGLVDRLKGLVGA